MMLIMRHDTATHVAAKQNWDTVLRGLKKPEQEGLKRSLLKSISRTLVQTPAGLIIPGATYEVDLQRLANVGSRITAGLFFRERSYRLPDTYKIETHPDPFFTHDDPLKLMQSLSPVLESSPKRIGNGVFTYWRGFVAEDEKMSMWLMLFFDSFSFVSLTAPIEDVG
ncbi:MAG TPA: hypothetical protein VKP65_05415 [Rhodothermales bacterium]|nr:hypothetical protein [Rhodothermales bacterium]